MGRPFTFHSFAQCKVWVNNIIPMVDFWAHFFKTLHLKKKQTDYASLLSMSMLSQKRKENELPMFHAMTNFIKHELDFFPKIS